MIQSLHSNRVGTLLALFGLALATTAGVAQQDFSKVQIKVTKVAGSVYMLEGSGGNIGALIGEEGIAIVDDEFAPLAPKIKEALKGVSDKPLKYVLNTHFHGDHTGGNAVFGAEVPILAHENVRKRLEAGGPDVKPAPHEALPVITFNDRATLHFNGEEIRALHFPHGHTDGDSVIYFRQSNVVHMGDDFVTYGFPFVDTRSGGTVSGMIDGLEKVLELLPADVRVIPGHGPISTSADVRKFIAMMKDTRAIVADGLKQGRTPDQMKQDHVLAKYQSLGTGFIKTDAWIDVLCADIDGKPEQVK